MLLPPVIVGLGMGGWETGVCHLGDGGLLSSPDWEDITIMVRESSGWRSLKELLVESSRRTSVLRGLFLCLVMPVEPGSVTRCGAGSPVGVPALTPPTPNTDPSRFSLSCCSSSMSSSGWKSDLKYLLWLKYSLRLGPIPCSIVTGPEAGTDRFPQVE